MTTTRTPNETGLLSFRLTKYIFCTGDPNQALHLQNYADPESRRPDQQPAQIYIAIHENPAG